MGISEIMVILLVAIILMKPDDIPIIVKKIKNIRLYFRTVKSDLLSYINLEEDNKFSNQDHDMINYYLEKIASHGEFYEGEYDLEKIRNHFNSIVAKKINKEKI